MNPANPESAETRLSLLDKMRLVVGLGSLSTYAAVTIAAINPEVSVKKVSLGLGLACVGILQAVPPALRMSARLDELEHSADTDSQQKSDTL